MPAWRYQKQTGELCLKRYNPYLGYFKTNTVEYIDSVKINFSPDQLILLNICLGFLMFGVALDIKVTDFKRLIDQPKAPIIGLISQLIWLPLLTMILVYFLQLPPSMSLGMILIAACPGGNVSNYAVHLAKANTALSVLMTSTSTLLAIFITPIYFSFLSAYVPNADTLQQAIYVDPVEMFKTIIQLIVFPLGIGMLLNHYYPGFTKKIQGAVKTLSMVIFFGIVIFAIVGNYKNIMTYVRDVFFVVLLHNTLAFILGYQWAKVMGLEQKDRRAISIETGIQNSGLALILVFNFFDGLGGMALVAAWWGIWHLFSGFAIATYWARRS